MTVQDEPQYVTLFRIRNGLLRCGQQVTASADTLADSRIAAIVDQLPQWPGRPLTNHKDFSHPLHLLSFLAELGLTRRDKGLAVVYKRMMETQSAEGPLQLELNIPKGFGGSGRPEAAWLLSDAPLTAYCAIKLNGGELTTAHRRAVDHVVATVRQNGWPCAGSPNLGRFRGPGRKGDPCPYATLLALKMLSVTGAKEYLEAKETGLETLLGLWDRRKDTRPYLFGMGTEFQKLKLPFVWYDILHVVDVLSRYKQVHGDKRFRAMATLIEKKRGPEGYVPESVYMAAREWDFGQKKEPSPFMDAVVERIAARVKDAA